MQKNTEHEKRTDSFHIIFYPCNALSAIKIIIFVFLLMHLSQDNVFDSIDNAVLFFANARGCFCLFEQTCVFFSA